MEKDFLALKTDPQLLSRLERAAKCKPSSREIAEQRVSFVYGSMKDSSGVTRERVRQVLSGQ